MNDTGDTPLGLPSGVLFIMAKKSNTKHVSDLHRLLRIITLIQSGAKHDHASLSEELHVVERTLYRDLRKIKEVGISIDFSRKHGRFVMHEKSMLKPLQLDAEEAMALAALCREVAAHDQIAFTKPASRAMTKIMAQLPDALREEVEETTRRMVIRTERSGTAESYADVFQVVQDAIIENRAIQCRYESAKGGESEPFTLLPYALFWAVRAWYVVGWHDGRSSVRSLKLSRFSRVELSDRTFKLPGDFSLDGYLGNAWRMIKGDRDYKVILEFEPAIAETIAETQWHKTQETEFMKGGKVRLTFTVSGLDEIVWWVLSMGASCTVVEPAELVDRVMKHATELGRKYSRGS